MPSWVAITENYPKAELMFAFNQRMEHDAPVQWIERKNGMWAVGIPKDEHDYIYRPLLHRKGN